MVSIILYFNQGGNMICKKSTLHILFVGLIFLGISNISHADSGLINIHIPSKTALTVSDYPYATESAAIANSEVAGSGVTDRVVVEGVMIEDNSYSGWNILIGVGSASTPGLVQAGNSNANSGDIIAYTLTPTYVSGTLAAGLSLNNAMDSAFNISSGSFNFIANGTVDGDAINSETINYKFNLLMNITNAAMANKLAGTYTDTITLTLSSTD
jgi:hypothetical protein